MTHGNTRNTDDEETRPEQVLLKVAQKLEKEGYHPQTSFLVGALPCVTLTAWRVVMLLPQVGVPNRLSAGIVRANLAKSYSGSTNTIAKIVVPPNFSVQKRGTALVHSLNNVVTGSTPNGANSESDPSRGRLCG